MSVLQQSLIYIEERHNNLSRHYDLHSQRLQVTDRKMDNLISSYLKTDSKRDDHDLTNSLWKSGYETSYNTLLECRKSLVKIIKETEEQLDFINRVKNHCYVMVLVIYLQRLSQLSSRKDISIIKGKLKIRYIRDLDDGVKDVWIPHEPGNIRYFKNPSENLQG